MMRESAGEIAGAGSNIRDHLARAQRERFHDFARFLPRLPLLAVQHMLVLLRRAGRVMLVADLRRKRRGASKKRQKPHS